MTSYWRSINRNMQLPANSYVVKVKEVETARGDIRPDMLLVMDPAGNKITVPGEETVEPTFGLPAMWVSENYREEALFRTIPWSIRQPSSPPTCPKW